MKKVKCRQHMTLTRSQSAVNVKAMLKSYALQQDYPVEFSAVMEVFCICTNTWPLTTHGD